MAQNKKNQHKESLIDYVKELQELNDVVVEYPQANIDSFFDKKGNLTEGSANQFALDYCEIMFARFLPRYLKAYALGKKFAKKNKKFKSLING